MDDALYDELAEMESSHWWVQGRRRVVASVLHQHLGLRPPRPGHRPRILDLGCGTGEMLGMLTELGRVTGLDMSEKAAAHCRRRFGDRIDVRVGRIPEDVSDVAGSPDLITAFDVLEHLHNDDDAVRAVHQALADDGLFVCTVPAFPFLWSRHDDVHHHRRRYTRRTLAALLRDGGFQIERLTYFNSLLFPLVVGVRLLHRLRPPAHASDLALPPAPINAVLTTVFASEGRVLRRGRASFPAGVSLLAVARKRTG